jgi:putative exonuclease SbcCD C subunit/AAA domain-containing protein
VTALFHVRRIQLINFHNFVDETLEVRKNLFLIGDNQSGKTTVLDAVHFALSAGVEMEFNAAARFGPRTEPGRNLASIVLRYDLERDVALRGPSVTYAAIEVADESGGAHTFGAGAFAPSLDAHPDVWGFVARGRTLTDVELRTEEPDRAGVLRPRPRDRRELEASLGRGAVFDRGRYRTAVAQLLFQDRDAYERVLELIASGKAYREMVARARNLDDLFIGLLPPPAETEFEEVRSALRAIEGIRSDLADLDAELGVMRSVIEKLQEATAETEKIARYELVGAELERRSAAAVFAGARAQAETARRDAASAEQARSAAAVDVAAREQALRALRATEGATLLEREQEARQDLAAAEEQLARAQADLRGRQHELDRTMESVAQAGAELETARALAGATLRALAEPARETLDYEATLAVGLLVEAVATLDPGTTVSPDSLERPFAALRRAFEAARDAAAGRAAVAEEESKRLSADAEVATNGADEIRRRAEVPLDLPGYGELLAGLPSVANTAVPLYRLFALAPDTPESTGAGIECLLGPRILGAIVVPPEQHSSARAHVLAHGGGVEVIDPSECDAVVGRAPVAGRLPAVLVDAEVSILAGIARAFLERVAGDVRILRAGEPRGDADRAVWVDGHIFEDGAESRVEPGPPRFLGAEARARAAAQEESRLRDQAERLRATSRRAEADGAFHRRIVQTHGTSLERLAACVPGTLVTLVKAAGSARSRLGACEALVHAAGEQITAAQDAVSRFRARHEEILAAVARAGVADLRDRIARMEVALDEARTKEKEAIDQAGQARKEREQRDRAETDAEDLLTRATERVEAREKALAPLVEARYLVDVQDYVFRVMRGNQIRAENLRELVAEAERARARAFQWLDSSDGVRNERLWQKYAFRVNETAREIRDQSGRPVAEVFEQRETEVHDLGKALDERTRDLLERVVMAGLVRRLQGQVRDLQDTIQGVNRLASDLRFGTSRFQFSLRKRPEFVRLLDLLREQSILQPVLREELRDFFQARLDDLRQGREGEVPEVLDYRRWFEYVLQVQSRSDGTSRELSRQRLRFGSTGEQAVPTYLLVLAVASLLYERTDARLRLLLLDEAFLGIDAGRREVLMQFADRAGVDLIVATPELDGVTPALAASSTLFLEKTAEQDVYVSDYHWERPDVQPGLFDRPGEPTDAELVLGVAPPTAAADDDWQSNPPERPPDADAGDPSWDRRA